MTRAPWWCVRPSTCPQSVSPTALLPHFLKTLKARLQFPHVPLENRNTHIVKLLDLNQSRGAVGHAVSDTTRPKA